MYRQPDSVYFALNRGRRQYELKNHLGNVMATVSDRKLPKDNDADDLVDYYKADVLTASDYYPFGMQMPGRHWTADSSDEYRFGFNGMEKDNEVKGHGNSYNFNARMYDPRLGRFLSVDPKFSKFPKRSPYVGFNNTPIFFVDPSGETGVAHVEKNEDGKTTKITIEADIHVKGASTEQIDKMNKKFNQIVSEGKSDGVKVEFDVTFKSYSDFSSQKTDKQFLQKSGPKKNLMRMSNNYSRVDPTRKFKNDRKYVNNSGRLDKSSDDLGKSATHEALHLIGLSDRYTIEKLPDKSYNKLKIFDGWGEKGSDGIKESSDIMAGGERFDKTHIDNIVDSYKDKEEGSHPLKYTLDKEKGEKPEGDAKGPVKNND
jgi:RHS repeat-associated protein